MKFLALEKEFSGVTAEKFKPHLQAEAARVWELYQTGVFRELYFRQDRSEAVLMLECADAAEAKQVLGTLPLVKEGLITFDLIPLLPYPGFARLFAKKA
ncbi:MAG: superoxide dismutase [Anaerolineae bacterium]|nr:superoxide dismutase [Anaerolineae bacterium]